MNLDLNPTPYTKMNAKWIADWHVKCRIMNVLEKMWYISLKQKTFALWNHMWREWKDKDWQKIFAHHVSDKRLVSKT